MSQSQPQHIVCPHCEAVNRVPPERLGEQPVCGKCGKLLFEGKPIDVTSAQSFDKHILRNDIPVVVDFWATWCGPCKMMAPQYAQAATQLEPKARLLKVDTEALPDVATRFNIRSIPTLILFKGNTEIARQPGAMDARSIVSWVQSRAA
jgi:thioredoxin 2